MAFISGLASGLDTATIVNQLMQLEARPQALLVERASDLERQVSSLQTVNSKLASIATNAQALTDLADWSPTKASSNNEFVTVSADQGALPTSLSLTVDKVATAARQIYTMTATADDTTLATPGVEFTVTYDNGRESETIKTGDGSLRDIADSINESEGLRATLVKAGSTAEGEPIYQLHVSSAETGANSGFDINEGDPTAFLGGPGSSTDGAFAQVTVNGQVLTSESNTFEDLMPGVNVTISAGALDPDNSDKVTITVERDAQSMVDKVQKLVDSMNAALKDIASLTAYDADSGDAGILSGDSTLRDARNRLLSVVTGGINGQTLAQYGIETDRTGELTFDAEEFKESYAASPEATAAMFAAPADPEAPGAVLGLAARIDELATRFSDPDVGLVTLTITGREDRIERMEDDIADWDVRLEQRRIGMERQYAALEVALSKMQGQSQWLAGQIAGLPNMLGE